MDCCRANSCFAAKTTGDSRILRSWRRTLLFGSERFPKFGDLLLYLAQSSSQLDALFLQLSIVLGAFVIFALLRLQLYRQSGHPMGERRVEATSNDALTLGDQSRQLLLESLHQLYRFTGHSNESKPNPVPRQES